MRPSSVAVLLRRVEKHGGFTIGGKGEIRIGHNSIEREKVVVISDKGPTVLLGERINPSGKKKLAEALKSGDFSYAVREAVAQVEAGADILDVNVAAPGVDEVAVLPEVVRAVNGSCPDAALHRHQQTGSLEGSAQGL